MRDDTNEHRQPGDRRRISLSEVSPWIGLVVTFATFVWGASAIKSSVEALREAVVVLTAEFHETKATVNAQSIDIGKMSVDISNLKDRVNKK